MKFKNVTITLAALTLSAHAAAVNNLELNVQKNLAASKQVKSFTKPDFGAYKVERNLALVPASIAATDAVVEKRGNEAVVKLDKQNDLVLPGTLVRNIFTGNLAPVSGNISVLLGDNVSAGDIAAQTGFKLVSEFTETGIAVVSVDDNQDVLEAAKKLRSLGLVKEARIEVLEARHTSR